MDTLGQRIAYARELKGITQQQLRDILAEMGKPLNLSFLWMLENDNRQPSIETLAALAVALDVDGSFLLEPLKDSYSKPIGMSDCDFSVRIPSPDMNAPLDSVWVDSPHGSFLLKSKRHFRLAISDIINDAKSVIVASESEAAHNAS